MEVRKRENVKMRHYVHSIPKFGFAPWSHGGNTIPDASYSHGKENISEDRASGVISSEERWYIDIAIRSSMWKKPQCHQKPCGIASPAPTITTSL